MGGKSGQDFGQVAAAQGDDNRQVVQDQLYANRPTQYTPWGYNSWETQQGTDPVSGEPITEWSNTQGLTPELQDILNKQIAIQGGRTDVAGGLTERMGNEFGSPMNWDGLSPMGNVPTAQYTLPEGELNNPYQTRQAAEDAVYNQAQSRLQPRFDSQRKQMEIKLRNQGLSPGDEAYNSQMQLIDQQQTDANNQAMWSANQAGRDEAGQMFGMDMSANQNQFNQAMGANQQNFGQAMQGSAYANQIRQQQIAEMQGQRGQSLNEINALLSGQQVGMPQMPNFTGAQAAQPAPIYQGAADQASINAASNPFNALIGAAGSLGGGYLASK